MKLKIVRNQVMKSRISSKPIISVIIPARNESSTIGKVVRQCKQLHPNVEVIVVANGCTDATVTKASRAGAHVIMSKEALGQDTGRALGANHARGSILLFVDADMVIPSKFLKPFIAKIQNGYDIALNSYPLKNKRFPPHPTVTAKQTLNIILKRPDIRAASLTCVPFAITRLAMDTIGVANLAVPPLAHAIAITKGLKVGIGGYVNVGFKNKLRNRSRTENGRDPVCELILGDHLEAIAYVIQKKGPRAGFNDLNRLRIKLHEELPDSQTILPQMSHEEGNGKKAYPSVITIIPACNESSTISTTIRSALAAGSSQVLVVDNGSTDHTSSLAIRSGAQVLQYDQRLGHDIGRAVGAKLVKDSHILVTDADIPFQKTDLQPFLNSVQNGTDVALNNLNHIIQPFRQFDSVSIVKRFLNLALNRPDLGICSLTAVPHALSQRAIHEIGAENLAIPPLAYVISLQKGLIVKPVHEVEVVKRNRLRPQLHSSENKSLSNLIIGDHVEALAYLLTTTNPRGPFPDTIRRRDLLQNFIGKEILQVSSRLQ